MKNLSFNQLTKSNKFWFYVLTSLFLGIILAFMSYTANFIIEGILAGDNEKAIIWISILIASILVFVALNFLEGYALRLLKVFVLKTMYDNVIQSRRNINEMGFIPSKEAFKLMGRNQTIFNSRFLPMADMLKEIIVIIAMIAFVASLSWVAAIISVSTILISIFLITLTNKKADGVSFKKNKISETYLEQMVEVNELRISTLGLHAETFTENRNKKNTFKFLQKTKYLENKIMWIRSPKTIFNILILENIGIFLLLMSLTSFISYAAVVAVIAINTNLLNSMRGFSDDYSSLAGSKKIYNEYLGDINSSILELESIQDIETITIKQWNLHEGATFKEIEINKGQHVLLTGVNGAGKSVLIGHLRSVRKDFGLVKINGKDVEEEQLFSSISYLTGSEEIFGGMPTDYIKNSDDEFINKLINIVPENVAMDKLSLGQKQALNFVVEYQRGLNVLILDEAFSGFAKKLIAETEEFLNNQDKTIIYTTHLKSSNFRASKTIELVK